MDPMPDHVGYCGNFAFRAMLHQFRCQQSQELCKLPAVLDILATNAKEFGVAHYFEIMGGKSTIDAVLERGSIPSEECLKFESIFPIREQGTESASKNYSVTYSNAVTDAFSQYLTFDEKVLLKDHSNICPLRPWSNLTIEEQKKVVGKLARSVNKKIGEVIGAASDKSGCPRLPIPPADRKMTRVETAKKALTAIEQQVKLGHAVMAGLVIQQPGGTARGPHAITVTNTRQTCCGRICVKEFQVIDSLGYYWTKAVNGWVSEQSLLDSLRPDQSIVWLEPK